MTLDVATFFFFIASFLFVLNFKSFSVDENLTYVMRYSANCDGRFVSFRFVPFCSFFSIIDYEQQPRMRNAIFFFFDIIIKQISTLHSWYCVDVLRATVTEESGIIATPFYIGNRARTSYTTRHPMHE